jgi:SSS family solute:Na+ symporter
MNGILQIPVWGILLILLLYFGLLVFIAQRISSKSIAQNSDFFTAGKKSAWYLVAYGMIGASLSGVTFVSIPGVVGAGKTNQAFSYMQVVLGYFLGYLVIAQVLLPLYYRMGLSSIYQYLESRFGNYSYKTGSIFFLISRSIGSAFRLYLAVLVMDMLFKSGGWDIPFPITALCSIMLIWVYTQQGGLKVIVWTDTLQTTFMLLSVAVTIWYIYANLDFTEMSLYEKLADKNLTQFFFFEKGWADPNNFFKQVLGGMFITIVMTGLDQDMMQKNLSCRNLADAQKNMYSFSIVLIAVNFMFLLLGALLYLYMYEHNIELPTTINNGLSKPAHDLVFPNLAMGYMPIYVGIIFIIGLVAAAYSTADSGLTALTTSFCIDILGIDPTEESKKSILYRKYAHLGMSALLFLLICSFWLINDSSVINQLFTIAGYTYGPLLGLFSFGLFVPLALKDKFVPYVCVLAPILSYVVNLNSATWFNGYKFGFELLLVNGLLTFLGLLLISTKKNNDFDDKQLS